jgi:hypothetical protein
LENTFLVFIDTPAMTGSDVLATQGMTGSSALIALDPPDPAMPDPPVPGVKLDFSPEFALAVWNVGGVQTALLHDLTDPMDDPAMSGGVLTEGMDYAVDNSNQAGVNESFAADPVGQTVNAATATTGVEFKIPLASLGLTTATRSICRSCSSAAGASSAIRVCRRSTTSTEASPASATTIRSTPTRWLSTTSISPITFVSPEPKTFPTR